MKDETAVTPIEELKAKDVLPTLHKTIENTAKVILAIMSPNE